jgi:hypothetical protein
MMAMVYDFHFPREFSSLILCLGGGADKLRQPRSQRHNKPMNITTGKPFFYFQTLLFCYRLSLRVSCFTPNIHTVVAQRFISVSAQTEPAVELQSDETLFGRDDFHL